MESSILAPVLSFILSKMVERNDKIPLDESKRTVFHSSKVPLISLHRYLERVLSFAPCSNSCFIIALIYIDRIIQNNSDFILNSLSVHRMLITSVMLATKFFDDETFNNLYYAKVGGLQVFELNQLETKFLTLINFTLIIPSELYDRYQCELVKHAKITCNAKVPVSPLRSKLSHDNFPTCKTLSSSPSSASSLSSSAPSSSSSLHGESSDGTPSATPPNKSKPLSRSTGANTWTSDTTNAFSHLPKSVATPPSTRSPIVRSLCEALVTESEKYTNKKISLSQVELMQRATELLNAEEKQNSKLLPGSIKVLCAKLAKEYNMSPSIAAKASYQVEKMERVGHKDESNLSSFEFATRGNDGISSTPPSCDGHSGSGSSSSSSSSSSSEGGGGEVPDFGTHSSRHYTACTPSYPSTSHHMVVVLGAS